MKKHPYNIKRCLFYVLMMSAVVSAAMMPATIVTAVIAIVVRNCRLLLHGRDICNCRLLLHGRDICNCRLLRGRSSGRWLDNPAVVMAVVTYSVAIYINVKIADAVTVCVPIKVVVTYAITICIQKIMIAANAVIIRVHKTLAKIAATGITQPCRFGIS